MAGKESRTFMLDKDLVSALASSDISLREKAAAQLPEALSRVEVSDIAMQVSLVPGAEAIDKGQKLEKEVLFHIGIASLLIRSDLVTTGNAAKELFSRGDWTRSFLLKWQLQKTKKQIVKYMLDIDSTDV